MNYKIDVINNFNIDCCNHHNVPRFNFYTKGIKSKIYFQGQATDAWDETPMMTLLMLLVW